MNTNLADKIRMFRGFLDLGSEEFWKKCGIVDSFSDYDNGQIQPPYEALQAMESMGLNLNFLFNNQEPMLKKDLENLINVVSEGIATDDSERIDKLYKILENQIQHNIDVLKMLKDLNGKR